MQIFEIITKWKIFPIFTELTRKRSKETNKSGLQ